MPDSPRRVLSPSHDPYTIGRQLVARINACGAYVLMDGEGCMAHVFRVSLVPRHLLDEIYTEIVHVRRFLMALGNGRPV